MCMCVLSCKSGGEFNSFPTLKIKYHVLKRDNTCFRRDKLLFPFFSFKPFVSLSHIIHGLCLFWSSSSGGRGLARRGLSFCCGICGHKRKPKEMTWCNDCNDVQTIERSSPPPCNASVIAQRHKECLIRSCPSCGHQMKCQDQARIHDLPGLPAGVKFDPTDLELLEHLEGKVKSDTCKVHPLIDEFIPTIDGENGICYTHPEKLPGVSKDGLIRHFFHRPSKAYTTGTRKRRKVHTDTEGGETRWHKTGKTRPVVVVGKVKGYKKILVLYTNYGKQRKPEKTNWVMHQYHLGNNEEEKDGELVVSKVFYQTQPRQCGSLIKDSVPVPSKLKVQSSGHEGSNLKNSTTLVEYYNPSFISFDQSGQNRSTNPNPPQQLLPHFALHDGSSLIP